MTTAGADIDTTALADLERALKDAIPCQNKAGDCDLEAVTRAIYRHTATGDVCHTRFFCAAHAASHKAFIALPGIKLCRFHHAEVSVTWHPLHPGRR